MRRLFALALLATVGVCVPCGASTIHFETPDAGALIDSAQVTFADGSLSGIQGRLSQPAAGGDVTDILDIDLFKIFVIDPAGFSAFTIASVLNVPDPQLFLFDGLGHGVFMNDDDPANPPQSRLDALPGGLLPGFYFLGIGFFDNQPIDGLFNLLFDPVSGLSVDPGAVLAAWNGQVNLPNFDVPFEYEIGLTGTGPAAPEPGTLILLGSGVVGALARRRYARGR